ncbi:MAG TPA: hypothetical protein VFT62_04925 [Mycobacteriales bacterium]|nr:hypothetical protein [Mycobacteriales bacterium]
MTAALIGVLLLLTLAFGVGFLVVLVKARTAGHEVGQPDQVSEDVVSGLLSELRKWQAEAAHWKSTAERLQRELDQRP